MTSLSDNLKIVLLAKGEEGYGAYDNYGDVENANWELIESALSEKSDITINTANVTLSDAQQVSLYLDLSGTLTGNRDLILKSGQKGFWLVNNATSGAFDVTIKPASGTGFALPQGYKTLVFSDGSTATSILSSYNSFSPSEVSVFARTYLDDTTASATMDTLGVPMRLIETKTLSGASEAAFTTGFSSDYDEHIFQFVGVYAGTDGQVLQCEFSENGGSSYISTYKWSSSWIETNSSSDNPSSATGSAGTINLASSVNNTAAEAIFGKLSIFVATTRSGLTSLLHSIGVNSRNTTTTASAATTSRVNAVRFTMSVGTMTGIIRHFAVKNT